MTIPFELAATAWSLSPSPFPARRASVLSLKPLTKPLRVPDASLTALVEPLAQKRLQSLRTAQFSSVTTPSALARSSSRSGAPLPGGEEDGKVLAQDLVPS